MTEGKNLLESEVFLRSKDDLIKANILTESIELSDKFWELFYINKSKYIMETMMYPIHILMGSADLGEKVYDYYHIVQNIMIHEKPEFKESLILEQKYFEREMKDENWKMNDD
tara:strand:- start:424 stop:762 length:339 start_codon:yes stop_codon:yes gene_type:complete